MTDRADEDSSTAYSESLRGDEAKPDGTVVTDSRTALLKRNTTSGDR